MPNKQNETQVSKIKTNVERLVLATGAAAVGSTAFAADGVLLLDASAGRWLAGSGRLRPSRHLAADGASDRPVD